MSIRGGFSLSGKRLFPVVTVGIPHHDSRAECDLSGALLRCVFLAALSETNDNKREGELHREGRVRGNKCRSC